MCVCVRVCVGGVSDRYTHRLTLPSLCAVPGTSEGCLVFGTDACVYADAAGHHAASLPQAVVQAAAPIDSDGSRLLIGLWLSFRS